MKSITTLAAAESGFRFVKRDIGKGHRAAGDGDCTVRAFALAAGLSYRVAWQMLYQAQGRHRMTGFRLPELLDLEPDTFGVVRRLPFPAERGAPRMTAPEFAARYPRGSYVLRMAGHVAAIEDGVLYDSFDCSDRCIYTAWQIDPRAFAALRQQMMEAIG